MGSGGKGFKVGVDHDFDEFLEGGMGFPVQDVFGFGVISDQAVDFGGAEEEGVLVGDVLFPVQVSVGEGGFEEFLDGVGLAGCDHVVGGGVLLEHEPHGFDVFFGIAPVAFRGEVAQG